MFKLMFFWIPIMANYEDRCFLELFLKALSIKKKFNLYNAEKESVRNGKDLYKCDCPEFSKWNNFNKCQSSNTGMKRNGCFERFLDEENSIQNFILKSIFGFIGGILLTYIFFIFLVFSLNFTLKKATYICMVLGVILSLGLAFSVRIRCTVFLCIPQLFSKRGRQALLAYAFILALSGPAKNTLHNVEVMSESLACKQEQLRQVENELLKCVQKPNSAAKKSIEKLLEKINSAVKDFKNFILELYKTCYDILETILHSQEWLYSITALCQKKIGRPTQRCLHFLREASENCQGISPVEDGDWKKECRIHPVSQGVICHSAARNFCDKRDVPSYLPVDQLKKQLVTFKHRAMNILFVRVEAHQTYSQSNASKIHYEEEQGVATEIRQKTDQFLQYFDLMSLIFGIFILVLFMKVIIYRYKFLTDDNYDNRYITSDFVDIDKTRAEFKMETILPLEPREKSKYIKVTSIRLVPCEKVRLMTSFVFLLFASFKIIVHMLTDSSLYWILSNIRREEKLLYMSSLREEEHSVTVQVEGEGMVADFVRHVTKAVKRQSTSPRLDPTPCLPDPVPPDWNRYYQISLFTVALVVICWLLALCEPYGLRLRHTVMVSYHPDRARERAIWLYNQIISDRCSFVKLARRDIRKRFKDVPEKDTLRFRFSLRKPTPKCLLCKVTLTGEFDRVKCTTFECPGLFCVACFDCLKLCSICNDPAEYGDLSDVSEEKDSSEEENLYKCCKRRKTIEEPVQKTEKAKESLELKFKRPSFNLCTGGPQEKNHAKHLIRPRVLNAFSFPKTRSESKKQRNLSELESSDWDASISSEGSRKFTKKKTCFGKGNERGGKTKKAKKMEKLSASFLGEPRICIFQKVSENGPKRDDPCGQCEERNVADNPLPDFMFNQHNEGAQGDSDNGEGGPVLKVKDSVEVLQGRLRRRSEGSSDVKENPSGRSKGQECMPVPVNVTYYEIKEKRYPFIDPINIHEMSHKWCESQEMEEGDEDLRSWSSERGCGSSGSERIRLRLPDSDSIQENLKLTITEQRTTSSPDSDCQCHSKPCKSSTSKIKLRKKKRKLKRTSGKLNLNLKMQKFSNLYSIETDSSNETFLSVKPMRKAERRKIKPETLDEGTREIIKMLEDYARRARLLKKSDVWKAKVAGLFKKNMADQESLGEDASSDMDAVEGMLKKAVFLSDEEFEKISKSLSEKLASEKKKRKGLALDTNVFLTQFKDSK